MAEEKTLKQTRELMVTIQCVLYPITEDVLHQIFDPYGVMEQIVVQQKLNGLQALISYQSLQSAISAKKFLHGRNIYDDCCRMKIQFTTTIDFMLEMLTEIMVTNDEEPSSLQQQGYQELKETCLNTATTNLEPRNDLGSSIAGKREVPVHIRDAEVESCQIARANQSKDWPLDNSIVFGVAILRITVMKKWIIASTIYPKNHSDEEVDNSICNMSMENGKHVVFCVDENFIWEKWKDIVLSLVAVLEGKYYLKWWGIWHGVSIKKWDCHCRQVGFNPLAALPSATVSVKFLVHWKDTDQEDAKELQKVYCDQEDVKGLQETDFDGLSKLCIKENSNEKFKEEDDIVRIVFSTQPIENANDEGIEKSTKYAVKKWFIGCQEKFVDSNDGEKKKFK